MQADSPCHGPVPVRAGNRAGSVHRVSTAESIAFHRSRPDPDRHPECDQAAGAIHLLEIPECASSKCRPADPRDYGHPTRTGLGGSQCETGVRHPRYRYDGAHAVRPADGRTQGLQPEEQGQEELPADADVYRRDAGIHMGRIAQRRPAQRQTDWRSYSEGVCGPAGMRQADSRQGRFRILLLGSHRGI